MCEVERVGVRSKFGPNKELTLFVVPYICDALTAQPISVCTDRYKHLSQLDLADASDDNSRMEVDVLVGCDHYWDPLTSKNSMWGWWPSCHSGDTGMCALWSC